MVWKLIMCAQYSDNNTAIHTAIINSDVIKINTSAYGFKWVSERQRDGAIDIWALKNCLSFSAGINVKYLVVLSLINDYFQTNIEVIELILKTIWFSNSLLPQGMITMCENKRRINTKNEFKKFSVITWKSSATIQTNKHGSSFILEKTGTQHMKENYVIIKVPVTGKLSNTFIDRSCENAQLFNYYDWEKRRAKQAQAMEHGEEWHDAFSSWYWVVRCEFAVIKFL